MKLLKQLSTFIILLVITSCVQNTQPKTITVKVDMNGIESHSKVGLRGSSPLSWNETTILSDKDGDDIYEETFEIKTANHDLEFKFVNNDNEFELQDQNNRNLTLEYKPETITYKAIFNNPEDIIITRN